MAHREVTYVHSKQEQRLVTILFTRKKAVRISVKSNSKQGNENYYIEIIYLYNNREYHTPITYTHV